MNFDAQGVKDFALIIAGIMVIVAAIIMIAKSRSGQVRDAMAIGGVVLLAAIVIAIGSHLEEVGNFGYRLLFN